MQLLKRGLMLITGIVAVALGGLFTVQNTEKVPLDLLVIQFPAQPIALWILLSMTVGVLLGVSSSFLLLLGRGAEVRRLRKQRDRLMAAAGNHSSNDSQ
ncbi:MAG: LapA family protein [Halieaceae bacterium]